VNSFFFKSANIWQSYKQEHGCLMHFVLLASTLLKDEESAYFRPALCFILVHNCGLTVRNKRICYVMSCYETATFVFYFSLMIDGYETTTRLSRIVDDCFS